ncbi:MAG: class D sortase [Steroidobacteraceae bacterium]
MRGTASNPLNHGRSLFSRAAKWIERVCWVLGGVASLIWFGSIFDASEGRRSGIEQLHAASAIARADAQPAPDVSDWSATRLKHYREALSQRIAAPVAVLRIHSVGLEIPVFPDVRELYLNRGAGLIPGTQPPGLGGNLGIAGHRDGFFRALKDVRVHDVIELQTPRHVYTYRIDAIDVVDQSNASALSDTLEPTITLVTCFPFYYVGNAPQRYVVKGMLERSSLVEASVQSAS